MSCNSRDILDFQVPKPVLNIGNQNTAIPLLFASADGSEEVLLTWDGWHESYEIEQSLNGGTTWALVAVTTAQSYRVPTTDGVEYYFRVRGFECNKFSCYSNAVQGVSGSAYLYLDGGIMYLDGQPMYLVGVA